MIIIVVAVVLFFVYFVFFRGNNSITDEQVQPETVRLRYVLQVSELPVEYKDNIKVGETILDYATYYSAGDVVSIYSEPSVYVGHNKTTGEQVLTRIDSLNDLYITVEGEALVKNHTYYINKTDIYIGKRINLMMPNLFCSGNCIKVEVVG